MTNTTTSSYAAAVCRTSQQAVAGPQRRIQMCISLGAMSQAGALGGGALLSCCDWQCCVALHL